MCAPSNEIRINTLYQLTQGSRDVCRNPDSLYNEEFNETYTAFRAKVNMYCYNNQVILYNAHNRRH